MSVAGSACGLTPFGPGVAQPATAPATQPASPPLPVVPTVYTAFLHEDQPRAWPFGIRRARILYPSNLWPAKNEARHGPPRVEVVRWLASELNPNAPVILNIEHWPTRTEAEANFTIERFRQTYAMFRHANPELRLGLYSIVPHREYWPFQRHPQHIERLRLAERNRRLAPLAELLDFICPSVYAFYNEPDGWEAYARGMIESAKAFGKPVFPFLWYEFHDNGEPENRGQRIPLPFWRRCLNLVADQADGMILWGGFRQQWDPNADWWFEVEQMMADRLMARSRAGRAQP